MNPYETLILDLGSKRVDELTSTVGAFLNYKLRKPWWSVNIDRILQSEGGFNLLVLRGITYILEDEINGEPDAVSIGLRRFSVALAAEYGNTLFENKALRFGVVEDIPPYLAEGLCESPFDLWIDGECSPLAEDSRRGRPTPLAFGGSSGDLAKDQDAEKNSHYIVSDYSGVVTQALETLTELERDLFLTYVHINKDIKVLCELTGRNYKTVKPQISRIRTKLQSNL